MKCAGGPAKLAVLFGIAFLGSCGGAEAGSIRSPSAVLLNTGGDFSSAYAITNAIDHSGLSAGFTNGVTDFDAYLAGTPTHTTAAAFFEWFSPGGVHSSTIRFDMGAEYLIPRLVLWNEESSGLASMSVFTTNDPTFTILTAVGAFAPADNTTAFPDYPGEVFTLLATSARYVQLIVTGPQVPPEFDAVAMGEIAFDTLAAEAVGPEPSSLILLGIGAVGVVGFARRRRS